MYVIIIFSIIVKWQKCANVCVRTYQCSTAEQDHEDDEGLEPVVFNDEVAGLPQEPPVLPPAMCDGNVATLVFGDTF